MLHGWAVLQISSLPWAHSWAVWSSKGWALGSTCQFQAWARSSTWPTFGVWAAYSSFPFNIQRADVGRLVVLHRHGGIYADLDVDPGDASVHSLLRHGYDAVVPMDAR